MSNGELLRQLFRGFAKRDDAAFRAAAEAVIGEERAKNHRLLADDLEAILINRNGLPSHRGEPSSRYDVPKDRERGFPLLDVAEYRYDWERIILPPRALESLKQIALEHHRRDVLAAGGLRPKEKVLFCGPPGCGKTLAAQVLASVLSYPMVTVRFDAVVSSYLGETAANLRRVFEFVERGQWVVLFDEFDAIGKDRDNPFEHGELKRVVNTLMQQIDAFRGESLIVAATNHEGLLDEAIWRRFEAVVPFTRPSGQDRVLLLRLFLRGFDCSDVDLKKIGRQLEGTTGADVEWVSVEAARRAVLDGRARISAGDFASAVSLLRERLTVVSHATSHGAATQHKRGEVEPGQPEAE